MTWVMRLVLVGAVVLAGCDSDSDGGGSDDEASPTPTPTVAPADVEFCDAFGAVLVGPFTEAAGDTSDPAVMQAAVDVTTALLDALVEATPPELVDGAVALRAEYESVFSIYARHGYDLARVDAEATPEELAILEGSGQGPAGPGAEDPIDQLEARFSERCAPDVTIPPELLPTSTTSP